MNFEKDPLFYGMVIENKLLGNTLLNETVQSIDIIIF